MLLVCAHALHEHHVCRNRALWCECFFILQKIKGRKKENKETKSGHHRHQQQRRASKIGKISDRTRGKANATRTRTRCVSVFRFIRTLFLLARLLAFSCLFLSGPVYRTGLFPRAEEKFERCFKFNGNGIRRRLRI